jgi:hypothetical protein
MTSSESGRVPGTGRGGGTGAGSPSRGYTAQTPPVRLSPDTKDVLQALAAAQGVRLTDVIREALEEYVARHRAAGTR